MTNACTQNTDRQCREEDCCLIKIKEEKVPPEFNKFFSENMMDLLA